jgi:hypothetical protein
MMTEEETLQAFSKFRAVGWRTANEFVRDRILNHDKYELPEKTYPLRSIVFRQMAGDFTCDLINELNRFLVNIHHADSWIQVANDYDEPKKEALLWEFADPMLELSVGRPYSLRNQFSFAVVHLAHQSNSRIVPNWKDDLPNDREITERTLTKVSSGWKNFPSFLDCLPKLNGPEFIRITSNFRHMHQHRFRLRFGYGLTPFFERQQTDTGMTYTYKVFSPLKLETLIPELYEQHARAVDLFQAYWQLLNEFCAPWMKTELK